MARERKMVGVPEVQCIRPYGLGIDAAKDFHAVCILVPEGAKMRRIEFEVLNLPRRLLQGKKRVIRALGSLLTSPSCLSYTVESTGTYHYPLMRAWGGRPCVVNPALATSFKARKTDRIDAYKLATHHLQGLWPESFVPPTATEVLRLLSRTRRRLLAQHTRLTNSISTRLMQWNCLDGVSTARKPLIRACIEDLAAGRYQAEEPFFAHASHVPMIVWETLSRLYKVIDAIKAEAKWVEGQLVDQLSSLQLDRLLTFPGVGPVTLATWCAEVEPISRFPTVAHCVAFCGLDPTPQISGGKQVGTRLRLGNSHIRQAMIQAGSILLNGKSKLAEAILSRGGQRKLLVCIAARKLASLLYKSSLEGISYDEAKVVLFQRGDGTEGPRCTGRPARAAGSGQGQPPLEEGV